jgi:hypothetical protein
MQLILRFAFDTIDTQIDVDCHVLLRVWNDGGLWLGLLAEVFVSRQTCRRYREIRADLMFFNKPIRIMRKLPGKLDTDKDAK